MTWRLAKSLEILRQQIDVAAPGRVKTSDGTIGDAAHASRTSDHNPWVKDGATGVVTALDITNDPRNGVDCAAIAEALKASGDPRIKYLIWNRRIWNPAKSPDWRPYTGINPHDKHMHVSVQPEKKLYDALALWSWGEAKQAIDAPEVEALPLLVRGITGQEAAVAHAKASLMKALSDEVGFGPLLDGLAKGFQAAQGLKADGKIGAYTWAKL